jgi:uncharacterized membrane protein YhaH (DUF805 family)
MKHSPHDAKRAAFWLVIVSAAIMGLALLLIGRNHKLTGALALAVVAILVIKHVGLFMLVGSPLVAALIVARARFKGLWRRHGAGQSGPE